MHISELQFHRLFSQTMYKNKKLPLGEMTFTKDFVRDTRGDLYPILRKSADCTESVENNQYRVTSGWVERVMGGFFPYATYELTATCTGGRCGFSFRIPTGEATIMMDAQGVQFAVGDRVETTPFRETVDRMTMLVTCRPGAFDVYRACNNQPQKICTFRAEAFNTSNLQKNFQRGYAALKVEGSAEVENASFYMDCGISQADLRPIRYETGEVMYEQGKVYLTFSARMEQNGYQGVFSWVPGTADFQLTGALFYDAGDGQWCGDVAASILYHRGDQKWYLWVCSFAHDHILGHACFSGDPRFGANVIDITLMEKAEEGESMTAFAGFVGDEDPDFYFDPAEHVWYMAICRIDPASRKYRYVFFRSEQPFSGYQYIGQNSDGAETGGSFVTVFGEKVFACGNDFTKRANYRIYTKDGMNEAQFDFDDGGFRGWGTIIPVCMGSRRRYFWLTFDRHNGSDFNWSYGNIYGFEAVVPE